MNKGIFLISAVLLGIASQSAIAKTAIFSPETEQPVTVMAIAPNMDGGFSGYTADAGVHHYDSRGRLIGSEALPFELLATQGEDWSFPPRLSAVSLGAGHHLITERQFREGFWWQPLDDLVDPGPNCAVARLGSGLKVTRLRLGNEIRNSTSQADSGGGVWIHATDGRVFRFGSDCRAEAVARIPIYLYGLRADPNSRSVLALTSDLELIRLSPDGIQWRRRLPDASSWQSGLPRLSVLSTGEVIVAFTSQTPGTQSYPDRIVAFSPQGVVLWNEEGGHDRRDLYATRDGFVEVETYGMTAWSRFGERRSSYTHPDYAAIWESGPTLSDSHVWARFATFHAETDSQLMVFNTATGLAQSWNIDFGEGADVAGLTDGRVVAYQWHNATHEEPPASSFKLATASSSFKDAPAPLSTLRHGINASAADTLGAALIVQEKDYWSIFVTDASMKQLWTRRIPDTETNHNSTKMQLALGTDRICVLTEIKKSQQSSEDLIILDCFRRADGHDAHPAVVWLGQSAYLDPVIAGPADVVFFGPGDRKEILRYLIDETGSASFAPSPFAQLSPIALPFCACDAIDLDDGSRALLWRAANRLLFFPASGDDYASHWLGNGVAELPIRHFAQGHGRLGYLGAHSSFLANEAAVTFYASDGTWLGVVILEADHRSRGAIGLLTATDDGWIAVLASPEIVHTWHIPKNIPLHRQGQMTPQPLARVSTRLPVEPPINQWSPSPWTGRSVLDFDGKHLVLASFHITTTSVYWLDPKTLAIASSFSLPFRSRARQAFGPEFSHAADGTLYLAGETPGSHGYQPALWKLAPALPASTSFSLSSLNGAWYDPSLSGQGFFLDYIEAANVLFGAWFTFSSEDTHQPSGLQWYTLHAEPTTNAEKLSGDVYLNRNGRFEQGPITHAERVGSFSLWPDGEDRLQITIDFDEQHQSGVQIGYPLQRVLPVDMRNGVRSWHDPTISGQGLLLAQPLDSSGPFFAGWFAYDPVHRAEGPYAQHWFTAQGGEIDQHGYTVATIHRTVGGSLGRAATNNVNAVGQLRAKLLACDQLRMEYTFDSSDLAGAFSGLSGERVLRPAAGCVAD